MLQTWFLGCPASPRKMKEVTGYTGILIVRRFFTDGWFVVAVGGSFYPENPLSETPQESPP